MKEIEITGIVGINCTAAEIKNALAKVEPGEDVSIVIDSPGGDVFSMIPMYNILRDFARKHEGKIETYIQGMAASCASVLALAAKDGNPKSKVITEDISVFMIHNSWSCEIGDNRDHLRAAEDLRRIDALIRMVYTNVTGRAESELAEYMNAESFFYGEEIIAAGFADEMRKTESSDNLLNAEIAKTNARATFAKMQKTVRENYQNEKTNAFIENRIAALASLDILQPKAQTTNPVQMAQAPKNIEKESKMTADEIKKQFPDVFAEIAKIGAETEKKRIQAHLKMAKDSGDINAALDFIESGVNCGENEVVAKYHEVFTKNALKNARIADNVPDMTTPTEPNREALIDNAFFAAIGVN